MPGLVPADHVGSMENLPTLYTDQHHIFVHARIHPKIPLNDQADHDLMWWRGGSPRGHAGCFVVHGHTPHPEGPVRGG